MCVCVAVGGDERLLGPVPELQYGNHILCGGTGHHHTGPVCSTPRELHRGLSAGPGAGSY